MPASTSGSLKVLIESLGLGLMAYGDEPAAGTVRPYVTITEDIATVPDPLEDGTITTGLETAQVDLWQDWKTSDTGVITEVKTLAPALRNGLHAKRLALIGSAVTYIVRVTGYVRLLESEEKVVHHALTLEINRAL